jgi:hypothetical protein
MSVLELQISTRSKWLICLEQRLCVPAMQPPELERPRFLDLQRNVQPQNRAIEMRAQGVSPNLEFRGQG